MTVQVRHLAGLACLDLEKAGGASKMREELNAMLKFIAVMDAVDTECVDPMWTPLEPGWQCQAKPREAALQST